jgi:ankyrin repeat protein
VSVKYNDTKNIMKFIRLGFDLNYRDRDGDTPLFNAVTYDAMEVFLMLIDAGVDLNVVNNQNQNIIDLIDILGSIRFLKWLNTYKAQYVLLSKAPELVSSLIKHNITFKPTIKKKFRHLFIGADFNLL